MAEMLPTCNQRMGRRQEVSDKNRWSRELIQQNNPRKKEKEKKWGIEAND